MTNIKNIILNTVVGVRFFGGFLGRFPASPMAVFFNFKLT